MKKIIFEKMIRRLACMAAVFCLLVPAYTLSAADFPLDKANTLSGGYLFNQIPLWKLTPENFATRNKLKLNKMPGRDGSDFFSVFLKRKAKWFGCPVEELKINSQDGMITGLTFVMFNKGDSVKSGSRKSALSQVLQRQERALDKRLSAVLGAGRNMFYGVNKRRCRVWYCREAALVLEYVEQEYMQLHVVPPAKVSASRTKTVKSGIKRKEFEKTANIERNERGDVYIKGIPMVDQGSKGYCVPATVERYFRYYGINDVDMHRIANYGKTKLGGGSHPYKTLAGVSKLLSMYGLRYENSGGLQLSQIAKRIDSGYPLIWAMYSSKNYLKLLKEVNTKRNSVSDPEEWKKIVRKFERLKKSKQGAHVCLIIGYNRKSGEIAVSNSWGKDGEIAWVPFRDAVTADAKEHLYIIKPR